jgi:dTMP kinase
VVSDRFIDASYAYQGGGRGIARQDIEYLDQWIVGEHRPDLTLLLDVSPDLGALRAEKRGMQKDRIEKEKNDFFMRVRHAYLEQAQQEPERIKIIDATRPLLEVEKQILAILNKWMATQ